MPRIKIREGSEASPLLYELVALVNAVDTPEMDSDRFMLLANFPETLDELDVSTSPEEA